MSPKVHVGGLTSRTIETWVSLLCAPHGTLTSVCVIKSKIIGQPFGYGFVEIGSTEKAGEAIMALTGIQLEGQKLDASSLPGSSPW